MSEFFSFNDTGTEVRARRDEIEGAIENGVSTEALMNTGPAILNLGSLSLLIEQSPKSSERGEEDAS